MFVIGIDPHRGSHAAAVLDGDERVRRSCSWRPTVEQRAAAVELGERRSTPRLWAVEGATGTRRPAGPAARRRRRGGGRRAPDAGRSGAAAGQRTTATRPTRHDARSTAIVALRNARLRQVAPRGPHGRAAAARRAPPRSDRGADPGGLPAAHHRVLARSKAPATAATGRTGRQDPGRHPPRHGDRRRTQGAGPRPARRSPPPRPRARRPSRPHRRRRRGVRHHAHRAVRRRPDRRRVHPRLQRRHRPVPERRALRPLQRHRPDRSLQRTQ